jgi:AcrR family transcriptional regulator
MSDQDDRLFAADQGRSDGEEKSLSAVRAKNNVAGTNSGTVRKILEGAQLAIARHGTRKLSMRDICDAAGVSSGTLYRYFATKEGVLTAVSDAISQAFTKGVTDAAAAHTDPVDQFSAVIEFHFQVSQGQQTGGILETEPKFVLTFLRDHFPEHISVVKNALAGAFDLLERDGGIAVDRNLFSELLIRIGLSALLVPGGAVWRSCPGFLTQLVRNLIQSGARPL